MTDQEIRERLTDMVTNLDPEKEYRWRHPDDFVADTPQSGERIRGRENMRAMQRAYPSEQVPTFHVRQISGGGDVWTVELTGDYPGESYHVVVVFELRDGRIVRENRYYAQPFEAPQWRAQWVEPMDAEPALAHA
jgi:hypothetical protein